MTREWVEVVDGRERRLTLIEPHSATAGGAVSQKCFEHEPVLRVLDGPELRRFPAGTCDVGRVSITEDDLP